MDNYSIAFYNSNGTLINSFTHADFFSNIDLNAGTADPKVIYDSDKDRFIMFLQSGNKSYNSKIIIAFSSTNNPSDKWWTYTFSDFATKSYWFDYPNVGLSNNSFYVTGNLFYNTVGGVKDNVVYQLNKEKGYKGESMSYNIWYSLKEGVNVAYSIVPASYGLQGNYGPGIFMVATEGNPILFGLRDEIYLFDITDEVTGTPQINKYSIKIPSFEYTNSNEVPAIQPNSSIRLDVGDPRMKSAFYLNDMVHFVFNKEINSAGYTGIVYGRLNTMICQIIHIHQ
jgi:hypothetical protein